MILEMINGDINNKKYKLFNDDCLNVMKNIPTTSIDLILTDLPFGTTGCKWDKVIDFKQLWIEYERIIKDTGSIILFSSGSFTFDLITSNRKLLKYKYVWIKNNSTNFVHAKNRPLTKHEDILVFSKAPMGHKSQLKERRMIYNPQGLIPCEKKQKTSSKFGKYMNKRPSHVDEYIQEYTNYPTDVLMNFSELPANLKIHTSEKPISLLEFLINTYTDKSSTPIVLDNCMGSGTCGVAALNCGCEFIGIELDKDIFNKAADRLYFASITDKKPKN